ncbi:hypothetical protein [Halalkalibacter flavus]|uniref:hypothetical protein n=1 Tax=Halalkalibacter flavus TaxID=3090668 RepID=UPI002FCA21C0
MTLVMSGGFGSYLSVMTADTRQVSRLKIGNVEKTFRYHDNENKASRLSDFTLFGSGGDSLLGTEIKERLSEIMTPSSDLVECGKALEKVLGEMRADGSLSSEKDEDFFLQIVISGFCKDGTSGEVKYDDFKTGVRFKRFNNFRYDGTIIAPSADHLEAIIKNTKFPQAAQGREHEAVINYLATVHATLAYLEQDTVSTKCNYYGIMKNLQDGTLTHFDGSVDTKGWINE